MTIPKYNELYTEVLQEVSDEKQHKNSDIKENIANKLDLTNEERMELLPSKKEPVIYNRIGWTITYLKKAEFLESKQRGYVNITKLGLNNLNTYHKITEEHLFVTPSFVDWIKSSNSKYSDKLKETSNVLTPDEEIEINYKKIIEDLLNQVLNNLQFKDYLFFKKTINALLLKMGYGEIEYENFNDNEINGLVNVDKLGINKVAIRVRISENNRKISSSSLQSFLGSFVGKGLSNGIFITNSSFTKEAIEYAQNQSIILINGVKLAELMIEYNIGMNTINFYEIKKLDKDFFNI